VSADATLARVPTETPAGPALECRDLWSGYGGVSVVRGINLTVHPGELVVLLGANGAGKTTLLLSLVGELPATRGEVLDDGVVTTAALHQRARNGLAFVPEERSVFRGLSCLDNLRIGKASPQRALELFPDLEPRLGVRAGMLSGGEQQMVSLGRALSMKPRVLVADELSLGLAPLIVTRLLNALRAAADEGCAVLLVEQHIRQALKFADTAHVLQRGRIEISGPAAELQQRVGEIEERYLSARVADTATPDSADGPATTASE
jgi:branched-chain amino acid transport system ATP-binding protein